MPESPDRRRARVLVRVLGCVVVGGALVGAAAGLLAHLPALVGLGLVIAAEEALEFAVVAGALRLPGAPPATVPPMRRRGGFLTGTR